MSLFEDGDAVFKGAIHGATLVLCAQMAVYNSVVYQRRGTSWHLFSACVYLAMTMLETAQVRRHWR